MKINVWEPYDEDVLENGNVLHVGTIYGEDSFNPTSGYLTVEVTPNREVASVSWCHVGNHPELKLANCEFVFN